MAADDNAPVGDAEREAAVRALADHLEYEQLSEADFHARCQQVADAVTRADIRAVFWDLPEPHPDLDEAVADGSRDGLRTGLMTATWLGVAVGGVVLVSAVVSVVLFIAKIIAIAYLVYILLTAIVVAAVLMAIFGN